MSAPALPLHHVPLLLSKGALKPCRFCQGTFGRIDPIGDSGTPRAVGRMKCEGCNRQIAWVGARRLRQAVTAIAAARAAA